MKQILALILTALLCGALTPYVLAAEDPIVSANAIVDTDSGSGTDSDISTGTATPSDTVTDDAETTETDEISGSPSGIEDSPVPEGFDYTSSVISFTTPDTLSGTFCMDCGDTIFTQLHSALDTVVLYGTVEKDGTYYSLTLFVTWDFSTIDAQTPGNYTAIGSISIPEGAVLSDGLENIISICVQVTSPVFAVSPTAITLTWFDNLDRTDAVAFAVGTTQDELVDWFADQIVGFTGYDADNNPYNLVSDTWSFDAVDTSVPGVYYASAPPNLGTEYMLADGVSQPRQLCAVSIQAPGEPDINCCVSARGFLRFPWVLSADQQEQLDEFAVWLRQDTGEWTRLSDGFLLVSDSLQLSQRILVYGSSYELKVTYPGNHTGVLTFQYDGELSILDYSDGDRDGGDAGGSSSGSGTQPVPAPVTDTPALDTPAFLTESAVPVYSDTSFFYEIVRALSEPRNHTVSQPEDITKAILNPVPNDNNTPPEKISESRQPAVVSESYSPTQTVISGLRLQDLCTDEENVVFGSGNLTASIPSNLLLALNLSNSDTLSVKLTQPKNNQIQLAVEVSGKSVTELTGTILRLRYMPQSENTEITVQNEAGEQITDASYDGDLLRFTADVVGTYTILEISNTQEVQNDMSPLLPLSGGLILAAGGITFFRRRRHG
ncbi:peptidase [Anaerovorax sp. IOR16]|uniref:peptidase n=1 Tax=Anaerovorax sp. IOR16 TaxID=2773458 RepID=UPI0019D1BBF7|nr:peptidase [Anaerovorax sp. IOR16]